MHHILKTDENINSVSTVYFYPVNKPSSIAQTLLIICNKTYEK